MARATTPARGQRRNPVRTQASILTAAREEFCENGFWGARIDEIAARSGSNKRMIYHYFGGKSELYLEVIKDAYNEIRSGERRLDLSKQSPDEAMRQLVRFTFEHFKNNRWFVRLLISENLQKGMHVRLIEELKGLHSPLVDELRVTLRRGSEAGAFRDNLDPIQVYLSIAGQIFFFFSNIYTLSFVFDREFETDEEMTRQLEHVEAAIMAMIRID